jgi:hypothetical protein
VNLINTSSFLILKFLSKRSYILKRLFEFKNDGNFSLQETKKMNKLPTDLEVFFKTFLLKESEPYTYINLLQIMANLFFTYVHFNSNDNKGNFT